MADFTITIGPVTSKPKTVTTAKAMALVDGYLAAYGLPTDGTNQQKINLLANGIAQHVREVARGYTRQKAERVAREEAEQNAGDWE